MLGTVAQVMALTAYGNATLQHTDSIPVPAFYPGNSAFQFCEYARFVDVIGSGPSTQVQPWAEDPNAWFDRLRSEGVATLRLRYGPQSNGTVGGERVPDRMLAGFVGGGGRWLIEALSPGGSDYWEARWQVGDRNRADQKIWRVTYGRIARGQITHTLAPENLEQLQRDLDRTFVELERCARSHRLESFATLFERSRAELSAASPGSDVYHTDLTVPGQLSQLAGQLLAASQLGWVFGGMGSWNDVGSDVSKDPDYQRLSDTLFTLLPRTYVAVADTTMRR